jgi:hypothetical protein
MFCHFSIFQLMFALMTSGFFPNHKSVWRYPIIKINKVDKLACSPAPGGYRVSYRVHMTIDYPDSLKRMMNLPAVSGWKHATRVNRADKRAARNAGRPVRADRPWLVVPDDAGAWITARR